jgi:hypothetical protein
MWDRVMDIAMQLARAEALDLASCDRILNTAFAPSAGPGVQVHRASALAEPFASAEFRESDRGGQMLILETSPQAELIEDVAALAPLGPQIAFDVTSPPPVDPGQQESAPDWEAQHSCGFEISGRKVFLEFESKGEVSRLASVSVHSDPA